MADESGMTPAREPHGTGAVAAALGSARGRAGPGPVLEVADARPAG